ncbi:hypothetical protein V5O48_017155 [Marasmius crinis-equi]|uniref:XPG-I domain-containing protein n=1 Tax=Marasmius crinis-equi TaxID=585013 RepID=A0ABR3EPZ8_9AGAR
MGINRVWPMLKASKEARSLNELAFIEGFQKNCRERRALTYGVDSNNLIDSLEAGSHHTLHGPSALESFFTLLCKYSEASVILHFVFDGPNRPREKRGKRVKTQLPVLYRNAQELITRFGYYYVTTEGKADCPLASLSHSGLIDGVISEDSNLLALGVDRVLQKSRESSGKELWYDVYSLDAVEEKMGLGQYGIILIALLTGNDTNDGLQNCSIETTVQLGRSELARDLIEGYKKFSSNPSSFETFLESWRSELREELHYNCHGYLQNRRPSAAAQVTSRFPNVEVLKHYLVSPIRLQSGDVETWKSILKPRLPDVAGIVSFCREQFHWSDIKILKRFNRNLFKGAVFRMLHSPLVLYKELTFCERGWMLKLLKEKREHTLTNGVEYVKATFLLDKILAITGLSNARATQLSLWVPLGVLQVAKVQWGLPQAVYDQAASARTMVEDEMHEDGSEDDIECLYIARRTASGNYILEFD